MPRGGQQPPAHAQVIDSTWQVHVVTSDLRIALSNLAKPIYTGAVPRPVTPTHAHHTPRAVQEHTCNKLLWLLLRKARAVGGGRTTPVIFRTMMTMMPMTIKNRNAITTLSCPQHDRLVGHVLTTCSVLAAGPGAAREGGGGGGPGGGGGQ
jgi:hypothetical protein